MTNLTADTVAELFTGAVTLAKSGEKISPRGMATREVLDLTMRLTQPRARLLYAPPARILNPAFAVAETVWHLSGSDNPWIFDYNAQLRQYADDGILRGAYGPRMRNWGGEVDQLHRVVEILKDDPDSRRATIQLYDPARDTMRPQRRPLHTRLPLPPAWRTTAHVDHDAWPGRVDRHAVRPVLLHHAPRARRQAGWTSTWGSTTTTSTPSTSTSATSRRPTR